MKHFFIVRFANPRNYIRILYADNLDEAREQAGIYYTGSEIRQLTDLGNDPSLVVVPAGQSLEDLMKPELFDLFQRDYWETRPETAKPIIKTHSR
jgi:hypothetical protein